MYVCNGPGGPKPSTYKLSRQSTIVGSLDLSTHTHPSFVKSSRSTEIPESLNQSKNINVLQVNLNKSNSAMQELAIRLRKEINIICMITEPSVVRHRLSGIPRHYNSIPTLKDNSPRAAIFTSPSIPIQEISNLSQRDLVFDLIKLNTASLLSN